MARFSSVIYKSQNCTLAVYKSKPKKKVLLLSTRHKHVKINSNTKKTPESIEFYNKTKFGVDVMDQMARKYSTKSSSRRWPLQVFFNILDLAGINAWILYKETTGDKISRKTFCFNWQPNFLQKMRVHGNNKILLIYNILSLIILTHN